jgi:hypothetical protein
MPPASCIVGTSGLRGRTKTGDIRATRVAPPRGDLKATPADVETLTPRVGNRIRRWPRTHVPELASLAGMTDKHRLNLATHRSPNSVWERSGWDGTREQLATTRWLVGIGGAALAVQGLRQRSITGSLLAGVGSSLAWWALTGEGDMSEARRWAAQVIERAGWRANDQVHDASADSFPASDAPAWTPTVGTGVTGRARPR